MTTFNFTYQFSLLEQPCQEQLPKYQFRSIKENDVILS